MINKEELWQAVLAQTQLSTSRASFATWFYKTKIVSINNGEILISVPNSFSKEWLSKKYHNSIFKIIRSLNKNIRTINYVVNSEKPQRNVKREQQKREKELEINQLRLNEFEINQTTNLNPRYTFDNFVIGSFNETAHAAAWAVSENPGFDYNPLFIYGGVGLGKTHLLEATGNKILEKFSKKKVVYAPAERFTSKIVSAIREHKIEELKTELRNIDVLIMDDIQFLAGKEKTQEEFFHIFNALRESNKQIILSSDRPPKAIPALEERLRSRFEGGMIMDIGSPDFETRMAILKTKCEEKNIELKEDILEYIVTNIQKNIRELEGALNRLLIFNKMNNKSPDIEITKKLLHSLVHFPVRSTNYKKIVQMVTQFYDLKKDDLFIKTRRKEIVKPRQIAMYLLRSELKESYPSIGRKFGGKDHTTAIYACEKISKEIENNPNLINDVNLIKQRIYSGTI